MSKKRLAASLLVVLFGILANILIFRYEPALSEKKVTVKVTLTSDEENYMEMFYLTDGQKMPDDFKAEKSWNRENVRICRTGRCFISSL